MQGLARPTTRAPLTGAQRAEVLARPRRDVGAELERDAPDGRAADAHVEVASRERRHGDDVGKPRGPGTTPRDLTAQEGRRARTTTGNKYVKMSCSTSTS